ncbi:MAG: hypothetical protein R6W68_13435, partial [Ignavibacteriaceae bacterium]
MKKVKIYIFMLLSFILLDNDLYAQNFFPTNVGDTYQFRKVGIHVYPQYYTTETFSNFIVSEYVFQNDTYLKISNNYYRNDTTSNKLYILINNEEKLAFDFSKPSGSTDTLYFDGNSGVYTYSDTSYQIILGENRALRSIHYSSGPFIFKYTLVEGIGYYEKYYRFYDGLIDDTEYFSVISAIIGSTILNLLTLDISPVMPSVISHNNPDFDIVVNIEAPYTGLVDSLSAEVVVYSSGSIIYQNIYQGNIEFEKIDINIPTNILSQADSVGFRIECSDESIFNNKVVYPETGFHFVPVVSEVAWSLIVPQIYAPNPHAMKFFTTNRGFIYARIDGGPNPPEGIKNRTLDGGLNFTTTYEGIEYSYVNDIITIDNNTGYILLDYGGLKKTTNGGDGWFTVLNNLSNEYSISFLSNDTGWVSASVFNNGNEIPYIFRTYDGGNNWTSFETPSQENFYLISFFTGTKGCAISTNGKVYLTEDAGETWSFTNSTLTGKKYLKMVENNSGWCVGNGIWKTTDGGESWIQKRAGSYIDAYFVNEHSGWVISSSTLIHTYDGGETWNIIELPESAFLFLDFIDSMHGWIYTSNEKLLRTTNGGVTFIEQEKNNLSTPEKFYLNQNYPNPFNPSTIIIWQVPVGS